MFFHHIPSLIISLIILQIKPFLATFKISFQTVLTTDFSICVRHISSPMMAWLATNYLANSAAQLISLSLPTAIITQAEHHHHAWCGGLLYGQGWTLEIWYDCLENSLT